MSPQKGLEHVHIKILFYLYVYLYVNLLLYELEISTELGSNSKFKSLVR